MSGTCLYDPTAPRFYAYCCRWRPVDPTAPIQSCGECGERPRIDASYTKADYESWREGRKL